jgi:membrane protein implicated in regulation of membrane protease activity
VISEVLAGGIAILIVGLVALSIGITYSNLSSQVSGVVVLTIGIVAGGIAITMKRSHA